MRDSGQYFFAIYISVNHSISCDFANILRDELVNGEEVLHNAFESFLFTFSEIGQQFVLIFNNSDSSSKNPLLLSLCDTHFFSSLIE